jgi:hypothetical protein
MPDPQITLTIHVTTGPENIEHLLETLALHGLVEKFSIPPQIVWAENLAQSINDALAAHERRVEAEKPAQPEAEPEPTTEIDDLTDSWPELLKTEVECLARNAFNAGLNSADLRGNPNPVNSFDLFWRSRDGQPNLDLIISEAIKSNQTEPSDQAEDDGA